jgi:hypothetical protein
MTNPIAQRPRLRHGLFVQSATALRLRERAVHRLVQRAKPVMPWLGKADFPTLRSWAELEILGSQLFANLTGEGPLRKDGEPRRLLAEYRLLKHTQLQYENALLMTPASRVAMNRGDPGTPVDFVDALARAVPPTEDEPNGDN